MPVLLLGLIAVAFVFWMLGRKSGAGIGMGPSASRRCNWEATGNDTVALGEYRCKSCKVVAYAKPGERPKECKRGLGGGL